jgi:hypothetical protein
LYATGWTKLDQSASFRDNIPGFGVPIGSSPETTPLAYAAFLEANSPPRNGYKSFLDSTRYSNIYYNGSTVWFMDSPETVAKKAEHVKNNDYGGIMLWNSNQDLPDGDRSLTTAISKVYPVDLNFEKRSAPFCLKESVYCNMRCDYEVKQGYVGSIPKGGLSPKGSAGGLADVNLEPNHARSNLINNSMLGFVSCAFLLALSIFV